MSRFIPVRSTTLQPLLQVAALDGADWHIHHRHFHLVLSDCSPDLGHLSLSHQGSGLCRADMDDIGVGCDKPERLGKVYRFRQARCLIALTATSLERQDDGGAYGGILSRF
jgi:hypothetical protein